jgi:hypothetical protein
MTQSPSPQPNSLLDADQAPMATIASAALAPAVIGARETQSEDAATASDGDATADFCDASALLADLADVPPAPKSEAAATTMRPPDLKPAEAETPEQGQVEGERSNAPTEPMAGPATATATATVSAVPSDATAVPSSFGQAASVLASTSQSMQRLEGFLGRLQTALTDLAKRPAPDAVDVTPLMQAVQTGLDASAAKVDTIRQDTRTAIANLADRVEELGDRLEQGVQQAATKPSEAVQSAPAGFLVNRPDRRPFVLAGLGVLVVAWSALFWFKTGSPRLALGTLASANLVACCLLLSWRRN